MFFGDTSNPSLRNTSLRDDEPLANYGKGIGGTSSPSRHGGGAGNTKNASSLHRPLLTPLRGGPSSSSPYGGGGASAASPFSSSFGTTADGFQRRRRSSVTASAVVQSYHTVNPYSNGSSGGGSLLASEPKTLKGLMALEARERDVIVNALNIARARWVVAMADGAAEARRWEKVMGRKKDNHKGYGEDDHLLTTSVGSPSRMATRLRETRERQTRNKKKSSSPPAALQLADAITAEGEQQHGEGVSSGNHASSSAQSYHSIVERRHLSTSGSGAVAVGRAASPDGGRKPPTSPNNGGRRSRGGERVGTSHGSRAQSPNGSTFMDGYDATKVHATPAAPMAVALLKLASAPSSRAATPLLIENDNTGIKAEGAVDKDTGIADAYSASEQQQQQRRMTPFQRIKQQAADTLRAQLGEEQVADILDSVDANGRSVSREGERIGTGPATIPSHQHNERPCDGGALVTIPTEDTRDGFEVVEEGPALDAHGNGDGMEGVEDPDLEGIAQRSQQQSPQRGRVPTPTGRPGGNSGTPSPSKMDGRRTSGDRSPSNNNTRQKGRSGSLVKPAPLEVSDTTQQMLTEGYRARLRTTTTARERYMNDASYLMSYEAKLAMFTHIYNSSSAVVRQSSERYVSQWQGQYDAIVKYTEAAKASSPSLKAEEERMAKLGAQKRQQKAKAQQERTAALSALPKPMTPRATNRYGGGLEGPPMVLPPLRRTPLTPSHVSLKIMSRSNSPITSPHPEEEGEKEDVGAAKGEGQAMVTPSEAQLVVVPSAASPGGKSQSPAKKNLQTNKKAKKSDTYVPSSAHLPARFMVEFDATTKARAAAREVRGQRSKTIRYRLDERDWWLKESRALQSNSNASPQSLAEEDHRGGGDDDDDDDDQSAPMHLNPTDLERDDDAYNDGNALDTSHASSSNNPIRLSNSPIGKRLHSRGQRACSPSTSPRSKATSPRGNDDDDGAAAEGGARQAEEDKEEAPIPESALADVSAIHPTDDSAAEPVADEHYATAEVKAAPIEGSTPLADAKEAVAVVDADAGVESPPDEGAEEVGPAAKEVSPVEAPVIDAVDEEQVVPPVGDGVVAAEQGETAAESAPRAVAADDTPLVDVAPSSAHANGEDAATNNAAPTEALTVTQASPLESQDGGAAHQEDEAAPAQADNDIPPPVTAEFRQAEEEL